MIELIGESNDNWNDAVKQAVKQASTSIPNITGVEVYNLTVGVSAGRLLQGQCKGCLYRLNHFNGNK